jgi:hypothetical protein
MSRESENGKVEPHGFVSDIADIEPKERTWNPKTLACLDCSTCNFRRWCYYYTVDNYEKNIYKYKST